MTTAYTSLLGLALPVTGELQGTWGDVVNNSITLLLDSAIAGTTTISTDGDVTLTTTTGASNQAREAIILCSGARTAQRTITAPAQSKIYTIINSTTGGYAVKLVGAGPTTGITVVAGESALVAWNGSDFIKISNTGGTASFTNVTVSGTTTLSGLTASTALALDASKNVVSVTNTGTGNNVLATSPTLSGVTLSDGTANGVLYLNGSKVATSGSALTFDGTGVERIVATSGAYQIYKDATPTIAARWALNTGFANAAEMSVYNGTSWAHSFTVDSTGYASWVLSGTEQMRLTSTGLGIGTSSPSYKLVVSNGGASGIEFGPAASGTSNLIQSYNRSGGAYVDTLYDAAQHRFRISGTEQMRLDSSGNLGIGTSSPGQKLTVQGGVNVTSSATLPAAQGSMLFSYESAVNRCYMGDGTGYSFAFSKRSASTTTDLMTLTDTGNLGLGVTPSANSYGSARTFFMSGDSVNGLLALAEESISSSTQYVSLLNNAYPDGAGTYKYKISTQPSTAYRQSDGTHKWFYAASGTAGNAITFTQAMTLDASGNLGLGATSPAVYTAGSRLLQIDGGANATELKLTNSTTGATGSDGTLFQLNGSAFYLWNLENSFISLGTNNQERARIDSSGNLLVGTTTASGKFVSSTSANTTYSGWFDSSASSGALRGVQVKYSGQSPNDAGNIMFLCADSTASRMYVNSNGGIGNYQANDVNLSDRREKTNFAPAKSYLDTICAIPVQTFNYIDQNLEEDPGTTLGVVAQDVEAVAPELVMESNWGTEDNPKMRLSIYQTDLQYALMKCIQELKAEVDALKAQLKG